LLPSSAGKWPEKKKRLKRMGGGGGLTKLWENGKVGEKTRDLMEQKKKRHVFNGRGKEQEKQVSPARGHHKMDEKGRLGDLEGRRTSNGDWANKKINSGKVKTRRGNHKAKNPVLKKLIVGDRKGKLAHCPRGHWRKKKRGRVL